MRNGLLKPLVWTVLVISATGNAIASLASFSTAVALPLGVMTVLCIALLIRDRFGRRRT
jgi:hypothetical protein